VGVYIHVPFCGSICSYCDFARTAQHSRELRTRYVAGVRREMELRRSSCPVIARGQRSLSTCYIGGGTPSELEPELMIELVGSVLTGLRRTPDFEFTVEANPETLTEPVASVWRDLGVGRVSLGVQSFDPKVLALLGRQCDPATARRALDLACRLFDRVSADWIIGPGLNRVDLLAELSEAADRGVEHFSVYILEIHPGTSLERRIRDGRVTLLPDAATADLYLAVVEHLASLGIVQYEVANFSRPGGESRHNRNYWRHRPWLGLGPGAHGFWGRQRYANHGDVLAWLEKVEAGQLPVAAVDELNGRSRQLERRILQLRTTAGMPLTGLPLGALDYDRGCSEGLWTIRDRRLRLTSLGFLRIDTIEERLARWTLG